MELLALRSVIYRRLVDTGMAPSRAELIELVGDEATTDSLLRQLHDGHLIVLDDRAHRPGEIRMALPFAAEPTDFRVTNDRGGWWANCAWDALAIIAALHRDGDVASTWTDTGEPAALSLVDGELVDTDGFISFAVPARYWWDDIVFT